jgi:uncharacterized repeat protein (TIGR01451 family)
MQWHTVRVRSRVGVLIASSLLAAGTVLPANAATTAGAAGPLALSVTGPDSGVVGVALTATAVVTNPTTATSSATDRVDFAVDKGAAVLQGATLSTGAACTKLGGVELICPVPGIAPGGSVSVTVTATPQVAGDLHLTVASAATNSAGITTPTGTDLVVPIAPAPTDVQVTGAASTGSPAVGSTFTYTFQVKDNGPQPAAAVTFSDGLPPAVTFVAVTSSSGSCSEASGQVSCALGDLAVGGQANVVLSVRAPATPQTITDVAAVAEGVADRQPSNNSVAVTVQAR